MRGLQESLACAAGSIAVGLVCTYGIKKIYDLIKPVNVINTDINLDAWQDIQAVQVRAKQMEEKKETEYEIQHSAALGKDPKLGVLVKDSLLGDAIALSVVPRQEHPAEILVSHSITCGVIKRTESYTVEEVGILSDTRSDADRTMNFSDATIYKLSPKVEYHIPFYGKVVKHPHLLGCTKLYITRDNLASLRRFTDRSSSRIDAFVDRNVSVLTYHPRLIERGVRLNEHTSFVMKTIVNRTFDHSAF
jgi:hypothetical protein